MIRPLNHFYKNIRAGELLELFLVSAVSSVLLTRVWLRITGYPIIGGHNLHFAHMLWGGILMLIAIMGLFAFIGWRTQRRASVVAGVGFGLFIDELGKFITRDNNYFFQPTVGLIYLTFVVLFMVSRYLSQTRLLSQSEYLLNALTLTQEAAVHGLEKTERKQALAYLKKSDQTNPIVPALTSALRQTRGLEPSRSRVHRWKESTQTIYERIIAKPQGARFFSWAFLTHSVIFFGIIIMLFIQELQVGTADIDSYTELVSAAISPALVLVATIAWRRNRLKRYRIFSIALLMNIFVTQFFSFYHDQFAALPGFAITLLFYIGVRSLIKHEQQLELKKA